jgi:ankyrin repeat protein
MFITTITTKTPPASPNIQEEKSLPPQKEQAPNQQKSSPAEETHYFHTKPPQAYPDLYRVIKSRDMGSLTKLVNEKNADVNMADHFGDSPVHWAVRYRNTEALKFLLSIPGIKLNENHHGYSALDIVKESNPKKIKEMEEMEKLLRSHFDL